MVPSMRAATGVGRGWLVGWYFAFLLLAGDRLCYNRLPCATTARIP
jgi:hypothetical protein